ncbi:Hsp20/alpha crystallin family protein [Oesophagostomum dentatum]|uniref:Hsp20/alpha crystallin family protein n=1 Tax=Oesophagostomum dentatum TaxID=61180 RepID=A0A0B1TEX5_OESDE|nr:Hsp20/alpha crystallin family protein [Oesophagostomum dentatum]
MSLCILPMQIFPDILHIDVLDGLDHLEEALIPLHKLIQKQQNEFLNEVAEDESKLSISLDVSQFKLEELKISLDDRTLIIEGKQENNDEQGHSMRSFTRRWVLPESVDIEKVSSFLDSDGKLGIEAPKVAKPTTARSIPISRKDPEK